MEATHYDSFAERYSAVNESSLLNAYYERPAMIELAGDVDGRRVLDAGCGSGPLSAALRAKGAVVTGFDVSPAMLRLARQRLGEDADLHVADLAQPLPFRDDAFDVAVASLVLHYLEDWTGPLAEVRRVLTPGGRLIVSVNHPVLYKLYNPDADYFAVAQYTEDTDLGGQNVELTYWHRPLHAMSDAFTRAGFRIAAISEPPFSPDTPRELLGPGFENRNAFLSFIFFTLDVSTDGQRQVTLTDVERRLAIVLPDSVRALYQELDGRYAEDGEWYVVWPLARVAEDNERAWQDGTLSTDLLAFGDDGTGNPFCVSLQPGGDEVVRWSWLDGAVEVHEGTMSQFLASWVDGSGEKEVDRSVGS